MDRDKRWERVKLAYDAMVNGVGAKATDAIAAIEQSYAANQTDEFIKPTVWFVAYDCSMAAIASVAFTPTPLTIAS